MYLFGSTFPDQPLRPATHLQSGTGQTFFAVIFIMRSRPLGTSGPRPSLPFLPPPLSLSSLLSILYCPLNCQRCCRVADSTARTKSHCLSYMTSYFSYPAGSLRYYGGPFSDSPCRVYESPSTKRPEPAVPPSLKGRLAL